MLLQHFMYLDSRNQTMSKQLDFRKCKVLAHIMLISNGRSTCTCCLYITDRLYHKIHEIPLKLLLLTLCIQTAKRSYSGKMHVLYCMKKLLL